MELSESDMEAAVTTGCSTESNSLEPNGFYAGGARNPFRPELTRAAGSPDALAKPGASDEASAWKRSLCILEEVSGLSLRHIPADRIDNEPANEGHAFCREMGQMQCVREGCQAFHVEMRCRALSPGAPTFISSCPSGFSMFAIPVHRGECGLIEGGRVLTLKPEKAMENLDKRLLQLGIAAIPDSFRAEYAGTRQLEMERLTSVIALVRTILSSVPPPAPIHEKPQGISKALRFIDEHLGEPISVNQVAKSACLSQGYFSKLFKKTIGLNVGEYMARARVARARILLKTTGRRVGEIAFESGFESIPHFNRMFKRFTGMTPRQTRFRE